MDTIIKKSATPDALSTSKLPVFFRWESLLILIIVLVCVMNSYLSPYFLDPWNLSDATFNFTEKALIALPMAMLIIAKEIDISVAAIISLSSTLMGLVAQMGAPVYMVACVGVLVGAGCGLFNGALVTGFKIPSIVVTIGTMSLFRGISYVLLGDQVVRDYPAGFEFFGQGYVYWVFSFELVLFVFFALVFYWLLHRTKFGRYTYAIGNNPTASYYSGIKVNKHRLILFTLVGVMSGIASVLLTSRLGSTRPSIATGWELSIITMVVLGGVSILGGSGTIGGVVLAVILMGLVTFGMGLLNIPGIVMTIIVGVMLITVVSVPVLITFYKNKSNKAKAL
ncbi:MULTISPECIES: ABC transporter permease [Marinomonas]|uniref:Autoinducer 2 import system permease protein LsrD n=1 Tax=Marinomonas arctica TaxID=383750 RepID=A0A7H1J8H9_9GAMM|nr:MULTISPECIES: ABC transporter permease [Marinomonas]MCS7487615.1 branched-chain amino acid ABC transporter permease [Marinomonas sp. BSi20414]QNT06795.1 ABC transporter permease [Marinomonas arctica]GGN23471.1 branched-chain amino acid ABC transporter permease [Marinomonas arctica]